jgi:fructoselysine 6-kinase
VAVGDTPVVLDQRADVACVGDNCVDVWLDDGAGARELAGGNALNVAVELARLGLGVRYFGAVGDDPQGELILEAAAVAGVDSSGVVRLPGPTGRTLVEREESGERRFVSEDEGVASSYRLDDASGELVARHRWAHFSRQPDLAQWAPHLRERGTRCSCDLGLDGGLELLDELGAQLDVVFLSSSAAPGRSADELLGQALGAGAELAVLTLGGEGSIAATRDGRWRADAEPVARMVDTLGAGDAFIAAFIAATLAGRDVDDALRAGARAGALACTRRGLASPLQTDEVPA